MLQVRPIFDNLNKKSFRWFGQSEKFSVDEIMIPYYGRHSSKQYIRGKPIRYGYKVQYRNCKVCCYVIACQCILGCLPR